LYTSPFNILLVNSTYVK